MNYYYLDRIQDFGVLWPVILESVRSGNSDDVIYVSREVLRTDPVAVKRLKEKGCEVRIALPHLFFRLFKPNLNRGSTFITASESSARPHRRTRQWVIYANKLKLQTITYQHGFENIGLTYSDAQHPVESVIFESDQVVVWVQPKSLLPNISSSTQKKLIFKSKLMTHVFSPNKSEAINSTIGVFENLHWTRYSKEYRKQFIYDLRSTAISNPSMQFILKPHIDEAWSEHQSELLDLPDNVCLFQSDDNLSAAENTIHLLSRCLGVVTTPSTIAVDSALMSIPVAVVLYDLKTSLYQPLFQICDSEGWSEMIGNLANQAMIQKLKQQSAQFVSQKLYSKKKVNQHV